MKRLRKRNGQFRQSYIARLSPIFIFIITALLCVYFQNQKPKEFITPFPVRAYEEVTPTPTVTPETVIFTPTPTPTPTPIQTEKTEILAYIVEVFGDDSADIITMVRKCENSTFDQKRGNDNRNGTRDQGVLQVNSVHLSGKEFPVCKKAHDNWKSNIDCGKAIFDKYGLSAWSCSKEVGITPFYLK